ncbi:MAG TPA: RND transporter, partial [Ferruginibacter sp.]|nr:RND transporter [Ferruginibacter sp.]
MWQRLAQLVLRNRFILLIILAVATGVMGYYASKVKLSYEFTRAIPTDNPKYQDYQFFRKLFGDDGNMMVIGVQTDQFFQYKQFDAYRQMQAGIKAVPNVEDIVGVPGSVALMKDSVLEKLNAVKIFPESIQNQASLDSAAPLFQHLP